jgi:hypothetical protein
LLLWLCAGSAGRASEIELSLQTAGQGYDVLTAGGDLLLRRRLSHWFALDARRLFDSERFEFALDFRLDADLEDAAGNPGGRPAMLSHAELKIDAVPDRLAVRLGRLMRFSELDFFRFDGAAATAWPWPALPLEIYAGFAVRPESLLGDTELVLPDTADDPPCPALGARAGWSGAGQRLHIEYRRVAAWQDRWPLEEERLAASGSLRLGEGRLGLDAGAAYNLLLDGFDRLRADAFGAFRPGGLRLRAEAGALYLRPFFSLDSIFNFFSPDPLAEVHGGLSLESPGGAMARLRFRQRWYLGAAPDGGATAVTGIEAEGGLPLGRAGAASAYATVEDGAGGARYLAWLSFRGRLGEAWRLEARALLSRFSDAVQPRQHALGGGGGVGATWIFAPDHALHLLIEANGNRLTPFSGRALIVLDLQFHFEGGPRQ